MGIFCAPIINVNKFSLVALMPRHEKYLPANIENILLEILDKIILDTSFKPI